jgi:hypothetical protein
MFDKEAKDLLGQMAVGVRTRYIHDLLDMAGLLGKYSQGSFNTSLAYEAWGMSMALLASDNKKSYVDSINEMKRLV